MAIDDKTIPLEDFHTFIRPLAGDVPSLVLDHSLQEGIIRFCHESRILVGHTGIQFQRGVRDYLLDIPPDRYMIAPDFTRGRRDFRNPADYFFADIFGPGRCNHAFRDGPNPVIEFEFSPAFNGECRIKTIEYSWQPVRDFCEVPAELYNQWMDGVKYCSLAELFDMPGNEWSSQSRAARYRTMAEVQIGKARQRKLANFSHGVLRMKGRPFVRGRRTLGSYYYGGGSY